MARYKIQVDVKLSLITSEGKPHEKVDTFIGTASMDLPSSLGDAHDKLMTLGLMEGAFVQASVEKKLFLAEEEHNEKKPQE